AVAVAAGVLLDMLQQAANGLGFLIHSVEGGNGHVSSRRGIRLKRFDRHIALHSYSEIELDHAFEELDGLGIGSQLDHGLLIAGAAARRSGALALHLAVHTQGVDLLDLDAEDLLHCLLDLALIGVNGDLEDVLLVLGGLHGLLGDDGLQDDIVSVLHYANTSSILARAAWSTTSFLALRMS